ncbi:carboxypeptidase regulatory-like domain-containing protein [Hymenobacter sp. B81]|uniref:carboxypeptidase regulatory-like domain-containing protein n=1 Tax=Hymenobacter sp. B81 TaxID=3344878 RepID=UPI0037DC6E14
MKTLAVRFFLLAIALFLGFNAATAGTSSSAKAVGVISGKLLDADTREAIPQANVIVLRLSDNRFVCSVVTRADGSFSVANLPFGQYRLRTTVLGYEQLRPAFQVSARQPKLTLGSLALVPMNAPLARFTALPASNPLDSKASKVGQASKCVLTATQPRRYARRAIVRS